MCEAHSFELVEGHGNGTFTHLVELNPLFVPLGAGVGYSQNTELSPEQIGGVSFHGRDVEAEHFGSDTFWTIVQLICNWKRGDQA